MKNRTLTVVLVTALVLIGAQVAWSAIPASNGKITGCYATSNGALRVVALKSSCDPATEKSVQWSQGPASFDQDVPAGSATSIPVLTKYGLTLSLKCYDNAGDLIFTLTVDPGSSGIVNGSFTAQIDGNTPVPYQAASAGPTALAIHGTLDPASQSSERLEGMLLARTATNLISMPFHMFANGHTNRCQVMGQVIPG
jgi:hypothetical protein